MSAPTNLDLDLLRTFVHIAETGSFTRAGNIVGRTQSAISMQVQRLEKLVDRPLFARGKGGAVSLTSHGSHLLDRAKQILDLNDRAIADLKGTPPPPGLQDEYTVPIKAQREAFNNHVMLTLLTNEQFTRGYALVMRCVEHNTTIDPATISREDEELIMALLSMLEYISINFLANTIDRAILLRQRRSGLVKAYQALAGYIHHKRQAWQRPKAYRSFETVVRDYAQDDTQDDAADPAACNGDETPAAERVR